MIKKSVTLASYKSMADKSLRICLDVFNKESEDVKAVDDLSNTGEVIMILCKEEEYVDTIMTLAKELTDKIEE